MRVGVGLIFAVALSACQAAPDVEKISADAQVKLQRQLNSSYGVGRVTARNVELIASDERRFEGSATVLVDGTNVMLPVEVMSDGKTTIVTSDHARVGEVIERHAEEVARAVQGTPVPRPAVRLVPAAPRNAAPPAAQGDDECDTAPPVKRVPSLDGGYVYLQMCRWATSDVIVQVRVSDGRRKEVGPGNSLAVIRNGPYRGYLLLSRHKYYPEGGSYDPTYVVRPNGVETLEVPGSAKDDRAVGRWLAANGWRAS